MGTGPGFLTKTGVRPPLCEQKSGFAGHILATAQRRLDHSVSIGALGNLHDGAVFQGDGAIFQRRIAFATSGIH